MVSTRHSQPLQIFEDPELPFTIDKHAVSTAYDLGQAMNVPLNSLPLLPTSSSAFAYPPAGPLPAELGFSPTKKPQPPSSSPPRIVFGDKCNISLPPPAAPVAATGSPRKQTISAPYQYCAPLQASEKFFSAFPSTEPFNKENMQPVVGGGNLAEYPNLGYGYKANGKRTFAETNPASERPSKKKQRTVEPTVQAADPRDVPLTQDDGKKPPFSYAALIRMSILRAPNRRLTLAQIYKWISDTFSYYRSSDAGWQNSIRHNLSLNKAFVKQERPKDDPGKGNYWVIEAGQENTFVKEKTSRRPPSASSAKGFLHLTSSDLNIGSSAAAPERPAPSKPETIEPELEEPSSDATLPASDPALLEDDDELTMPPPVSRVPLSSPVEAIRSSPPVTMCRLSREDTPAGNEGHSSANKSRSRKRKFNSMNDSGYFSSLESSALRPHLFGASGRDAVAPRFKRGRAEEEIARIRSSSHEASPSRNRTLFKQPASSLLSSSPIRPSENFLMLPPLTPAVTFKRPARPPASISPNTNLRNHRNKIRELIGSPIKDACTFNDSFTFSPAFDMVDNEPLLFTDGSFNIFVDSPVPRKSFGSPEKRSAKRSRIDRGNTTASILADVTKNSNLSKSNPALKPPMLGSPLRQRSPSKSPSKSPSRMPLFGNCDFGKDDFFGMDLFVVDDDETEDHGGLDLLQGFQRIGEKENIILGSKKTKSSSRSAFGVRSASTRF